jgi:hypothetical protein
MHAAPLPYVLFVVPLRVTVMFGLCNPPRSWNGMVGPSLPGFTIAPCVDSLMCYRSISGLSLSFKTVLKSKVRICISHIYILVVSLLSRFGEPLAHALVLWFLHVCVRYLLIT